MNAAVALSAASRRATGDGSSVALANGSRGPTPVSRTPGAGGDRSVLPYDGRDVELVSVAAVAENGVIGREGELPWPSIPEDRRQYRERVADDPVVIGRRTFEAMRDDLPGTTQIVLSRSEREYDVETAHHAAGVDDAVGTAETLGASRASVVGGGGIYSLFQPYVDRMVLSRIPGEYEGDTHFPDWDTEEWRRVDAVDHDEFTLEEWVRETE